MSRCVPIQTNVNTAEPFFALAGSGGGGDGNINTSSITYTSTLTFVNSDIPVVGSQRRPPMFLTSDGNTTTLQVNNTDPGAGSAIWLIGGDAAVGRGIIRCKNPSGGGGLNEMNIEAFSLGLNTTNSVSIPTNLTVSSINGVAPGGGGAASPNPKVSTLSFADFGKGEGVMNISTSLAISDATTPRGSLNFQLYPSINGAGTYVFPSTTGAIFIRSPNSQTQLVVGAGDDGHNYLASIDSAAAPAELTVAGATIYMSTAFTNIPAIGSISSLTVSSINGTGSALINPTQCSYHLMTGSGNNWNTVTFARPFPAGESVVVVVSPNVTNGATPTQYPLTRNETVVQFEVFGTAGTGINWIASSVV